MGHQKFQQPFAMCVPVFGLHPPQLANCCRIRVLLEAPFFSLGFKVGISGKHTHTQHTHSGDPIPIVTHAQDPCFSVKPPTPERPLRKKHILGSNRPIPILTCAPKPRPFRVNPPVAHPPQPRPCGPNWGAPANSMTSTRRPQSFGNTSGTT